MKRTVSFARMDEADPEDFALLREIEREERVTLPDRVLGLLRQLDFEGSGYRVTRLEHSLQTATRALRDGASDELVVCALLHDVGDPWAPADHGAFAAAILGPYVGERSAWVVRHHGLFQAYYRDHHLGGDRHARERHRGHPHFEACAEFCERWDQVSFDPEYDSLPLEAFEPRVRELFAREPRT